LGSKCQRVAKGSTASFSSSTYYKEEYEDSDDEGRIPSAVVRLPVKRKVESSEQSVTFDVSAVPTREMRGSSTPKTKHQLTIEDEGGEFDGDISMMTATVKLDAPTTAAKTKKPDLSKYVDEKLLNFDPSSRRNMVKMLPKTFSMPAPQPQPHQAKTRSSSVLGSSALLSTSLSSVESDADTAPVDLSMGMSALQDSSHPATTNSAFASTGAPPPTPPPLDYAAPGQPPDAGKGKGVDKRKRVSFAQPGAGDAALVDEAKKPKAQRSNQVAASEVSLSGSFGNLKQLTLNNNSYLRLSVLGKGGSSCVHRVVNESGQVFAYKKVDVRGNEESDAVFDSYVNEIELLRRLKGSQYIIELVDAEINREEMYIAMVMEAGEVDLSKVLAQKQRKPIVVTGSGKPTEPQQQYELNPFFIRLIWHEMLEAVDHIHENRIVHGDLKPANFVFVRGHLKLIDFGIAKAFSNDTTNIYRESQIGTVNYMAPEAIAPFTDSSSKDKGVMRLGKPSDIWSLGCILYQIIYGRPPFAALNTIQKLHAIPNVKYEISYPASGDADAVESIQACLVRNPRERTTIRGDTGLLSRTFLTHSTKYRSDTTRAATEEAAKQSSAISLQQINGVVEAVVDELSSTLTSIPNAEDLDSLGIVVWSRLNSVKSSVIADRAQTIIPSSSMSGAQQPPARPPLGHISVSSVQNQNQRPPTKDASPDKNDTKTITTRRTFAATLARPLPTWT
jgi:serine/threonine protein kinase